MAEARRFHRAPKRHPGFRDLTGHTFGSWTVLAEAPQTTGNTRWHCRHSCGAVRALEGIKLRYRPPKHCNACRPKRRGTVYRTDRVIRDLESTCRNEKSSETT